MVERAFLELVAYQRCKEIRREGADVIADYVLGGKRALITIQKGGSPDGYEFVESLEAMAPNPRFRFPEYIARLEEGYVGIIVPDNFYSIMKMHLSEMRSSSGVAPKIMYYTEEGMVKEM